MKAENRKQSVLVVDDDKNVRRTLGGILEDSGLLVTTAPDVESAITVLKREDLDLVVTDLKMPGRSGMDLIAESGVLRPGVPVIMISAFGDIEAAVSAMKKGAYDFITKPFDDAELMTVIGKALSESRKNRELMSAYFSFEESPLHEIIGQSDAIAEVLRTVLKIARTDSTVLITGETGVGKELIARAVHSGSLRRDRPFVKVNCAAIPENLLESELFGYERGAFTGAVTGKPGRFELAHTGTLFLDEVGEMPPPLQAKLLGVLQDRAFEHIGGVKTIKLDARLVAATNRDLRRAAQSGEFRPDLFYRLNVVPVHIPPLRERPDDIAPLAAHFLRKYSERYRGRMLCAAPEVLAALGAYSWPGNIRELENVIERMAVLASSDTLGPGLLPPEISVDGRAKEAPTFRERVENVSRATEKLMLIEALQKTGQNRTKAAELLGVSRRTLQNKIKEYGL